MFDPNPEKNPAGFIEPGIKQGAGDVNETAPSPAELKIGKAKNLTELCEDYCFYTPALLHLTVPLSFDPFDTFCAEYGKPVDRFTLRFDFPLFSGLIHPCGDLSWNYVLFGLSKEHWEAYRRWVGTIAFNDSSNGLLRRIRLQDLVLRDPLAKSNGLAPSLINVTALVVETNKGTFYYKQDVITMVPKATFDNTLVHTDVVAFAKAIQTGNSDPYGQTENE